MTNYLVPQVIAIDPADCGCTDCIVGLYVPLAYATPSQIFALLDGDIANHTGQHVDDAYAVWLDRQA